MNHITANNATCRSLTKTMPKESLMRRFKNYWAENNALIISGMMMQNGNCYAAYRTYKLLSE